MKKIVQTSLILLAACGSSRDPNGPGDNSGALVVQDNLRFQAETLIMESFPVQLRTVVRVTNTGETANLTLPDGCSVLLRVYRDEARTSLAFDSGRVFGCTQAIQEFSIVADEMKEFDAPTISAATILGDSLPNGTYYLSAVMRPNGKRIELAAGSAPLAK